MQLSINWLAVLTAGVSAFLLGGIWYSPALFGNAWMRENNFTAEQVQRGNKGKIFGWSFLLSLVMSVNLALFLADPKEGCGEKTTLAWGAIAGFLAGIWTFCSIAIVALFEQKGLRYILINGGYTAAALTLMGTILGIWR
jgi:hypothetical protein